MATITSPRPQSPAPGRSTLQSPSLTPSSSVRPSIDLPVNTNGRPSSPGPTPQRPRNRAALRDYYNLKSKPPVPGALSRNASVASITSESTVTSTTDTDTPHTSTLPPQLDDPAFDAEAYVRTLLRTETLRGVLKIEGTLVSEIRQLDGERKALVYDNYSKLIVATRTIGRMQRSLNDGDAAGGGGGGLQSMEKLRPAVEGVERVAGELGGIRDGDKGEERAAERQARRERREKRDLVRWVVEAPGRFEVLIREGRSEVVREEWGVVEELLGKWKGIEGVDEVRLACETLIDGIEKPVEEEEEEEEEGEEEDE